MLLVYQEFDHLLEEQSPIESYVEWLDSMVDRCVVKVSKRKLDHRRRRLKYDVHCSRAWLILLEKLDLKIVYQIIPDLNSALNAVDKRVMMSAGTGMKLQWLLPVFSSTYAQILQFYRILQNKSYTNHYDYYKLPVYFLLLRFTAVNIYIGIFGMFCWFSGSAIRTRSRSGSDHRPI